MHQKQGRGPWATACADLLLSVLISGSNQLPPLVSGVTPSPLKAPGRSPDAASMLRCVRTYGLQLCSQHGSGLLPNRLTCDSITAIASESPLFLGQIPSKAVATQRRTRFYPALFEFAPVVEIKPWLVPASETEL